MEKNTILLDLETYNILRDFKKGIEANDTILIRWNNYGNSQEVFVIDDAVIKIAEANKKLRYRIDQLENPEVSIGDIKEMNWWQFRKWKKINK